MEDDNAVWEVHVTIIRVTGLDTSQPDQAGCNRLKIIKMGYLVQLIGMRPIMGLYFLLRILYSSYCAVVLTVLCNSASSVT